MTRVLLQFREDDEMRFEFGIPADMDEIMADISHASGVEIIERMEFEFDERSGAALDIAWGLEVESNRKGLRTMLLAVANASASGHDSFPRPETESLGTE